METLAPNSPPSKRFKPDPQTLTLDPQISPSIKGKAPISDHFDVSDHSPTELPPQNCGICFSDEGNSVRGVINSCDHYFCFLCIIEWSKIESRCPLCRARFSNIRRMRKDGSFIGDGSVRIPVRDQIYDPFGEPTDPYAQAKCSVCDGHTDESLLLLCDLCDTAWHTYCVGLGVTVPEGDWYCQDCTLLRAEQLDDEGNVNVDQSSTSNNDEGASSTSTSTSTTVSIFDIVRDEEPEPKPELDPGVERLRKIVSAPTKPSSLRIVSDRGGMSISGSAQGSRCNLKSPTNVVESSARTLHNCRKVHHHISVLRENWDAFRTGSLSFSSSSLNSSHRTRKTNVATSLPPTVTSQSQDTLRETQLNKPYDVDRAWKLMNIARSMQQIRPHKSGSKATRPILNKAPMSKPNNVIASNDQKSPMAQMRKPYDKVIRSERIQVNKIVSEDASTSGSKYPNSSMSRLFSSRKLQAALEEDASHNRKGLQLHRKFQRGLSSGLDDGPTCTMPSASLRTKEISTFRSDQVGNINACRTSKSGVRNSTQGGCVASQQISNVSANVLNEPLTGSSNGPRVKLERGKSPKRPHEVGSQSARKSSDNSDVKVEIQSLVKLNLKLLTKDKRLGVDAFKEVARISTHTILAACGYEHRKIIHSYQTIECPHVDQPQQVSRCTLMPSSCRECFYVFVKNVVTSVMSDKLSS